MARQDLQLVHAMEGFSCQCKLMSSNAGTELARAFTRKGYQETIGAGGGAFTDDAPVKFSQGAVAGYPEDDPGWHAGAFTC